jgi:hypothetical protein
MVSCVLDRGWTVEATAERHRNLRRWLVKLSGGIYIGLGAAAAFSWTRPATTEWHPIP